jgi:hypothetical protein
MILQINMIIFGWGDIRLDTVYNLSYSIDEGGVF